jgi:hypothetical protein
MVTQPERPFFPYPIDLVIESLAIGVSGGYGLVNNGDCRYGLLIEEATDVSAHLRTSQVVGPCSSGTAVELRLTPEGALLATWFYPDGREWMRTTLTRIR